MKFLWTTINVTNMDASIAFYSDLAGLKALNRFPAGPGKEITFMGNGIDGETTVELMSDANLNSTGFGESISLGFAVDSMDEMLEKVKGRGMPVHSGPFETPAFKFFIIKDPDGLNIQFFLKKYAWGMKTWSASPTRLAFLYIESVRPGTIVEI